MFELYSVPSLTYAVDSVMSFYHNNLPTPLSVPFNANGLIVSFNTASTSVIPVLDGKGIMSQAKRCVLCLGAVASSLAGQKAACMRTTTIATGESHWRYNSIRPSLVSKAIIGLEQLFHRFRFH